MSASEFSNAYQYLKNVGITDRSLTLRKSKCKLSHFHDDQFTANVQSLAISFGLSIRTKAAKALGDPEASEDVFV